ncbi:MAG: AAA family ATPase, partial [Treponema sp.]|nr:AAA family ATPase [Treponema sp.]
METLVREWQARPLPEFTRRDMRMEIRGKLATAIIGMRRSGKTWRLFQEMGRLVEEGIDPAQILYFNFDDGRLLSGGESGEELLN